MKRWVLHFVLFVLSVCAYFKANASHLFGADLHYVYVSGNTYKVILDVYGDCSGSSFPNLPSSTPNVDVYNNGTLITTLSLTLSGTGVEVTPVCSAQINNTTCTNVNSSIPGVKKFTYIANTTLSTTSTNWVFRFNGTMGVNSSAGRSNTITNINIPGTGSVMNLEAMLNNTGGTNSNVTYTTIPTPFFCINKPAQYNPGAVDPNSDSLAFSLVDGLIAGGTVSYITPYTATNPLQVAVGTFSVSNATGQVNFTPDQAQKSLIVSKVNEYRNGVLVGYSMREMTFVVLSSCNNNPPIGGVSNANGGTVINTTTFKVCQGQGLFSFNINPTDADGDKINMSITGVPTGAIATISNNNTTAPSLLFSWNTSTAANGNYTFFITYQDDGCPLSSKQTIAYTVNISGKTQFLYSQTQAATCTKKGKYQIVANGTAPFSKIVMQGSTTIQTTNGLAANHTDSLAPGTYTIKISDAVSCFSDTTITITSPSTVNATYSVTNLLCNGISTGSITSVASNGSSPYQFALGNGNFGANPVFFGLAAGTYIYKIKDANDCTKDTTLTIQSPTVIVPIVATLNNALCFDSSSGGIIMNASGGTPTYRFALNSGAFSSNNSFNNLGANSYLITVKDTNGCTHDTTITINQPTAVNSNINILQPLCYNDNNGSITITGTGGTAPFTYAIGSSIYSSINTFSSLSAGTYILHINDINNCKHDTSISLSQPSILTLSFTSTDAKCFNEGSATITINGSGGTPVYTYALNANPYQSSGTFNNLNAGTYTLSIKDINGCTYDTTTTLLQPTPIQINTLQLTNPTCQGFTDGSILITTSGGTPSYQYTINNGAFSSSNSFTSLGPGNYVITILDNNSCHKDTTITLFAYANINIDSVGMTPASCFGVNDGALNIFASGGNPPLSYGVDNSNPISNPFFTNISSSNHIISVTDNTGCRKDSSVYLSSPQVLNSIMNITNNDCYGADNSGAIQVQVIGGNAPYGYLWQNSSTNDNISGLSNGQYFVVITDSKGCQDTAYAEVHYDDCCTVFVPNAFTPNNDGHNDRIGILLKGDMQLKEFSIYNRFGQRVFYSENLSEKWDGTFNGTQQELGTYFYYIKAVCGYKQDKEKQFKGDISLIR